jgi:hypothetical protein
MVVKPGSATRTCSSGRICYYNSAWSRPKLERRPFKLRDSCRPISEQTRGKYQISKDRLNPDALAEPKLRCNRTTHAFRILQFPASLPQNPPLQHPSQPSHSLLMPDQQCTNSHYHPPTTTYQPPRQESQSETAGSWTRSRSQCPSPSSTGSSWSWPSGRAWWWWA